MRHCTEVLGTICLVVWAGIAQAKVPTLDQRHALAASQAVVGTVPADFTLLDRLENPRRLAEYRGKPLLVSFIYTGCFTACPIQTRSLHRAVQGLDRLLGPHQFNVVSIGFNLPFDTPSALRAFAAQHRIDYPNWEFLSPHPRQVDELTRAYGFSYVETPAGFEHVVGTTIVDANGRIYGHVYGEEVTAESLGAPLRELLLNAPVAEGTKPSFADLLERVRLLCTVYDPETGEYRYDWGLMLEIVGGVGFFLTVGVYLWRERRTAREWRARQATDPAL